MLLIAFLPAVLLGCYRKNRQPPPAPNVTTAMIKQQDVPIYIDAIGQVIPTVTVNIRPQVAGKLIKTYIQQGAIVKEGDIIYEMDPRPYQAIVDEAVAQLEHDQALYEYAAKTVERYKKVVESDFISIFNF